MTAAAGRSDFDPGPAAADAAGAAPPVFTVGHSTRSIPEFATLLQAGSIEVVVDVRSIPRSRANPQYQGEALARQLEAYQIGYLRILELGGLRKHASDVAPDVNAFWDNQSFHNYADYALSDMFRVGFDCLLELSAQRRAAIMCAEAVWWRCHRRIIADYLIDAGRSVYHLMSATRVEPARPTVGVVRAGDGLHYPAPQDRKVP